jgi:hypothetical protein
MSTGYHGEPTREKKKRIVSTRASTDILSEYGTVVG